MIIDINWQKSEIVKIYYATLANREIFKLDWESFIKSASIEEILKRKG